MINLFPTISSGKSKKSMCTNQCLRCAHENIKVQFVVFIPPPQGQHMLSNIASDKCWINISRSNNRMSLISVFYWNRFKFNYLEKDRVIKLKGELAAVFFENLISSQQVFQSASSSAPDQKVNPQNFNFWRIMMAVTFFSSEMGGSFQRNSKK